MKFRRIFSLRNYFDSLKAVGKYPRLIKVFNLQLTYVQSLTKTARFSVWRFLIYIRFFN